MSQAAVFSASPQDAQSRLTKLARVGVWAATIALCLACVALVVTIWLAANTHAPMVQDILTDLGLSERIDILTPPQMWFATMMWSLVDMLGIAMLWNIRALFLTYRDGDIFSAVAAQRLRRIGWIILAMAPVSMFGKFLGGVGVSLWALDGSLHGTISIDDADVYAVIIGLVLVAAGHMMSLAAAVDAENREFI